MVVNFSVDGVEITAESRPELFSPKALDNGTQLLLSQLHKFSYASLLDWGCGWGAIALYAARLRGAAKVTAIDSDLSATKATLANVAGNNLKNVEVVLSDSYAELPAAAAYDIIASNPPTHRGREVVDTMIAQSRDRLSAGGTLLLVVEARIKPWVARQMKQEFGDYKILSRSPKHVVLMATK